VAETADDTGYDWIGRGDHGGFADAGDSWEIETPTTDVAHHARGGRSNTGVRGYSR
jgi:hypothetical protein